VQSRDQLVVIDPKRKRIAGRYPLPGCQHDHGLHLDPPRRLAFVACDGNATLLVLDLKSKRVLASATVGDEPDVLDFDTGLRRLYVAAESGVVAVFAEHGRKLIKLGQAFLAREAHSVAVDPRTHLVYFPLQDIGGRPVLRIMRPTQR
jgi:DNA-binding beta-propeller fold protein YncE